MEFRAMKNDAAIVARGTFVAAAWYATAAALLLAIATKLPSRASSRARDAEKAPSRRAFSSGTLLPHVR